MILGRTNTLRLRLSMRALLSGVVVIITTLLVAGPAHADPPGPTNYRTVVTGVSPATEDIEVRVLGGDSYLELTSFDADVLLRGYDEQELYLRWLDNGTVEVNVNSVTHYQNQSRYGLGEEGLPNNVGADVPPDWEVVSTSGTYAWHDHRIHWMSPSTLPPNVDGSVDEPQLAYEWPEPIRLQVDGRQVEIAGELRWFPDRMPIVPVLTTAIVVGVLIAVSRRRGTVALRSAAVLGVLAAGGVALAQNVGLSPGVQPQVLSLLLPALSAFIVTASFGLRDRPETRLVLLGMSGVPLIVWFVTNVGALTRPILPVGPDALVRLAMGAALGGGLTLVLLVGRELFAVSALVPVATEIPDKSS